MILRPSHSKTENGSALLILLLVGVLLVVVIVAFAAAVRVELQVSQNYRRDFEARQNALYGLRLAMGQLQEHAGRDQAVTARADIFTNTSSNNLNWIGVWDVRGDDAIDYSNGFRDADGRIDTNQRPPVWLISSPVALDPTLANSLGTNTVALVDTNSWTDTVLAGLVDIPTGAAVEGRYAYWVDDEGLKARVNLKEPGATASRSARHSFMTAQRSGLEVAPSLADYPATNAALPSVIRTPQLQYLGMDRSELRAHHFDLTTSSSGLLTDVKHGGLKKDLTYAFNRTDTDFQSLLTASSTNSASLPSYYLEQGAASLRDAADIHRITPFNTAYRTRMAARERFNAGTLPNSPFPWERGPTWESLRSYYNLQNGWGAGGIPARKATKTVQGISPVITQVILNVHPGLGPDTGTGTRKARAYIDFQAVLWNPYNAAIEGRDYNLELVLSRGVAGVNVQQRPLPADPWTPAGSPYLVVYTKIDAGLIIFDGVNPSAKFSPEYLPDNVPDFVAYNFRVKGAALAAGESRVFSIAQAQDGTAYSPGGSTELLAQDLLNRGLVYAENAIEISDGNQSRIINGAFSGAFKSIYSLGLREGVASPTGGSPTGGAAYNNFSDYFTRTKFLQSNYVALDDRGTHPRILSDDLPGAGYLPDEKITFQFLLPDGTRTRRALGSNPFGFGKWIAFFDPRAPDILSPSPGNGDQYSPYQEMMNYGYTWDFLGYPSIDTLSNGIQTYYGSGRSSGLGLESFPLFDIPRADTGLISLGALQQAQMNSLSEAGAFVFGNSQANPALISTVDLTRASAALGRPEWPDFVDLSYFVNEALWDGFFFSSIPESVLASDLKDPDYALPNSRIEFVDAKIPADVLSLSSAAHLMNRGGFNINSTSVTAWTALLAGMNGLNFLPVPGATAPLSSPFSRLAYPMGASATTGSTAIFNDWNGFRELSAAQVQSLATEIVKQVKLRGPFVSLAHFANRQLSADPALGSRGALAQAIQDANLNAGLAARSPKVTAPQPTAGYNATLFQGDRNHGATAWLTEGDLLQALAPVIAARSDTFTIRAYGEVLSAASSSPRPIAKAYCEAVVQRLPEFVDPTNPPATPVIISTDRTQIGFTPNPALTPVNANLGRKFKIISFRWLSKDEI